MLNNAKVLRGFLIIIFADKQENTFKSVWNKSALKAVWRVKIPSWNMDEPNVSESQTFSPSNSSYWTSGEQGVKAL